MSTVTRQWLMQQQRHPCVHKWEKRWVSKGNMMIFKWVRTENRAGTGTAEEKEVEFPAEDPSLAEGFLGEGGGTRRLTRGKAADMGITVESIADTNDALLGRAAPGENPRAGEKSRQEGLHEDGSSVSPADPAAESKAAGEPDGDAGKKRRRDEDGGEEEGDGEAKRSRVDAAGKEGGKVEEDEAERGEGIADPAPAGAGAAMETEAGEGEDGEKAHGAREQQSGLEDGEAGTGGGDGGGEEADGAGGDDNVAEGEMPAE